jgi:hypothetical protein
MVTGIPASLAQVAARMAALVSNPIDVQYFAPRDHLTRNLIRRNPRAVVVMPEDRSFAGKLFDDDDCTLRSGPVPTITSLQSIPSLSSDSTSKPPSWSSPTLPM